MEYITIQNSKLTVSRVGMGCCPMGGHGWGEVSESELVSAVHCALDRGVNFFDTADVYGLGQSERILGKSLEGKRSRAVIATKFGVRVERGKTFYDNSPEWIYASVQSSLVRLRTSYIDLYQLHYRDGKTPVADVIEALETLKDMGWIRTYGLSNVCDWAEFLPFRGSFASFQEEYSLACRENEENILRMSGETMATPLTWGSLGQGILSGKYREGDDFSPKDRRSRETYVNFHGEKFRQNLQIVEVMRGISVKAGVGLPAIAVRFVLDTIKNAVALVGVKRPEQLIGSIEAFGFSLDKGFLNELSEVSKAGARG